MSNIPDELTLNSRAVFVVHGRNDKVRRAMFSFLRSLGLQPLEWNHLVRLTRHGSPYVGDVLDVGFRVAQAAIVLFTPDDEAQLREPHRSINDPSYETMLTPQPRQNVILEAGMALGIAPTRTILVEIGNLRPISDLQGRHIVRMNNSHTRRNDLVQRLQTAGCPVDITGNDWTAEGDFEGVDIEPLKPSLCSEFDPLSPSPGYWIATIKEHGMRGTDEFEIECPMMQGLPEQYMERRINLLLEQLCKGFSDLSDRNAVETEIPEALGEKVESHSWLSFEVTLSSPEFLSIRIDQSIDLGGAHPTNGTSAVNLDLESGYRYSLYDLFKPGQSYLDLLQTMIRNHLAEDFKDDPYSSDNPPEPDAGTPGPYDFVFSDRELVFINLFSVHALQGVWVHIPYSELAHIADPKGPLAKLLASRVHT